VTNLVSPDEKALAHIIRQDYARALSAYEAKPNTVTKNLLDEVAERRARAIRSLHDDDFTVREISALFRTSKTTVRNAIDNG
jgi:hypothetical protein